MRTPSCVAAVDVLINGQALSTQAQHSHRCSQTFHDFPPSCLATINAIDYVFARVGRALLRVFPRSNVPALSYEGTQIYLTTEQYSPSFIS